MISQVWVRCLTRALPLALCLCQTTPQPLHHPPVSVAGDVHEPAGTHHIGAKVTLVLQFTTDTSQASRVFRSNYRLMPSLTAYQPYNPRTPLQRATVRSLLLPPRYLWGLGRSGPCARVYCLLSMDEIRDLTVGMTTFACGGFFLTRRWSHVRP